MDLYGITLRYVNQKDRPVLDRVHVDRETARCYFVSDRKAFLKYRSQITKSHTLLAFSPLVAWQHYVNQCNQLRASLRFRLAEAGSCQRIAMEHIMELEGATK